MSDCSIESKKCEAISSPYGEDTDDVELVIAQDSSKQPVQEMNKDTFESGLFPLSLTIDTTMNTT